LDAEVEVLTTPPAIVIDRTQKLLVVVRFQREFSDTEFHEYLSEYEKILEAELRFAAVFVTDPGMPMTPGRHARAQAQFMKRHRQLMSDRVVGVAFSLPTPLMRGVLRGILMLQPAPCPHTVVATEHEGVSWAKARLWSDHVRRLTKT